MKIFVLVIILTAGFSAFGQRSVASLPRRHAVALERFLSRNKQYKFLSETAFDKESLKEVRKFSGKNLKPYYRTGDFNHDGVMDFALILSKKGLPKKDPGVSSESHKHIYNLAVAVFNGSKNGTFKNAFVKEVEAPLVCFLDSAREKRKRFLSFGVFATDIGFIITPSGKTYTVKYADEH